MSRDQVKMLVVSIVLVIALHLNYQSGLVPEKDFWTIAYAVIAMIGVDIAKLPVKPPQKESEQ